MFTGKTKRWQRITAVVVGLVLVVIANRQLKTDTTDAPKVTSYVQASMVARAADTSAQSRDDLTGTDEETVSQAPDESRTQQVMRTTRTTRTERADASDVLTQSTKDMEEITAPAPEELIDFDAAFPYYLSVNRAANTVTVYGIDEDGEYSVPYKAFVCSAAETTILGTFTTSKGQAWGALYGGVYAQYSTRITGPFLFHSVPYTRYGDPSSLKEGEYNKLGSYASLGCIRLSVADCKWIYDNCPGGTTVTIYDDEDDPGPLGKPEPVYINPEDVRRGWDPTDPDPDNPWAPGPTDIENNKDDMLDK